MHPYCFDGLLLTNFKILVCTGFPDRFAYVVVFGSAQIAAKLHPQMCKVL